MKAELRSNLDGVDVLLIEDDPLLAQGLGRNLTRLGAGVTVCSTLTAARLELARRPWAVVVLDQMLPDGDGLDLLHTMAELERMPAIVAVSANLQSSQRSLALQNSEAVLLPKPFTSRELLVAISRALGRRESEHEALAAKSSPSQYPEGARHVTTLEHGPISLGLVSQTLHVDGEPIDLQPAQFRILATLLANAGRALPVTELAQAALRGTHQDGNVNIRFQIHGLRRRLGDRGGLIETCPGGYGIGVSTGRRAGSDAPADAIPDSEH